MLNRTQTSRTNTERLSSGFDYLQVQCSEILLCVNGHINKPLDGCPSHLRIVIRKCDCSIWHDYSSQKCFSICEHHHRLLYLR